MSNWEIVRDMQLEVNTDLGWVCIDVQYSRTSDADDYGICIECVTSLSGADITKMFDHAKLQDAVYEYESEY